jgi:hypothetical protein
MGNKIERFEELIAWQKARELTVKVYRISRKVEFAKDYRLSGQIQAAAVSIMSNIAEGFERGGLEVPSISFHSEGFLRGTAISALRRLGRRLYRCFGV